MPTEDAARRELKVVDQAVSAMRANAPHLTVTIEGRPDTQRGQHPEDLTVEVLIGLADGTQKVTWAADVMGFNWDPGLGPAVGYIHDRLHDRLAEVATRLGRGVTVLYTPHGVGFSKKERDEFIDQFVARVEETVRARIDGRGADVFELETQIHVSDGPTAVAGEPVHLVYPLGATALVIGQVRAALSVPLRKKLGKQLRRAHDLGYPTMLLLDRSEGGNPMFSPQFLAQEGTIAQVVTETIASVEHASGQHGIDRVFLIEGSTTAPIYGAWPTSPQP
jgi:hypothetical protein